MIELANPMDIRRAAQGLCLWCGQPARLGSRYCCREHGLYWARALKPTTTSGPKQRRRREASLVYTLSEAYLQDAKMDLDDSLRTYAARVMEARVKNPGQCQICRQLRAVDGAFCLGCADDLRRIGVL